MPEITTTKRQREILAKAINFDGRVAAIEDVWCRISRRFKNCFHVAEGSGDDREAKRMIEAGLLDRGVQISPKLYYVHATDAGIAEVMPGRNPRQSDDSKAGCSHLADAMLAMLNRVRVTCHLSEDETLGSDIDRLIAEAEGREHVDPEDEDKEETSP